MKQQVWFITGCSTGIGRITAELALAAGHHVVATARNVDPLAALQQHSQAAHLLTLPLDVTQPEQVAAAVASAGSHFGRMDVLLNNAGYGLEGTAEETPMTMIRQQMEVNFFGLVALTQAALPYMRRQQSGYIFNVASIAGLRGSAGMAYYNASKFAVVGWSEALAQEVRGHGIHVGIVEPGPYRTEWAGRSIQRAPAVTDPASPYREVNAKIDQYLSTVNGAQPGDPAQIARVLLHATQQAHVPTHLLFGDEAIQIWEKEVARKADSQYFRQIPHAQQTI